MKKCQACGYNNTDIMNYCLECGGALTDQPQMVVPLDSLNGQEAENQNEQITEVYENETVVKNRFAAQESIQTFQQQQYQSQQPPKKSNAKWFLAIGGGLFVIVMLFGVTAAGVFIYALNQEQKPPMRPIVSKTPIYEDDSPTPYPDDLPEIDSDKTPQPTPDTTEDKITFPTPKTATKFGKYEVRTVSGWQLSNIKTVRSQNFSVKAKSRIKLDGIKKSVGVKGLNGHKSRRIFKQYKTGALLMRTHYPDGRHSNIQPVGNGEFWLNAPDESGKIEFFINDNSPKADSGSFNVTVKDLGIQKE